jgi:hypothetical protein
MPEYKKDIEPSSITMKAQTLQLWRDGMNQHAKSITGNTNSEASHDSQSFLQAKTELGTSATIRSVARRAQELRIRRAH